MFEYTIFIRNQVGKSWGSDVAQKRKNPLVTQLEKISRNQKR